jgi:hypothetical protein
VAFDFLGAVLRRDDPQINACLTPLAVQRLAVSNKRFPALGTETTKFQVGEVRQVSETQAIVQCQLTDVVDDKPASDEICCVMQLVDNQWRVSGMAFNTGQAQPTVFDFENPPQPMSAPAATPAAAAAAAADVSPSQGVAAPAAGRPSPPRTATETPPLYNR